MQRTFVVAPGAMALLALTFFAGDAHAFAEDLCYLDEANVSEGESRLVHCAPVPAACAPGESTAVCTTGVMAAMGVIRAQLDDEGNNGRSMVHTDATYYLAALVGFDIDSAYWVAAYDEAADLGQYTPRDRNGDLIADPTLVTATIDGVTRTNRDSGGVFYHIHPPHTGTTQAPIAVDGLHPEVNDPDVEVTLANIRRWVYDFGLACTAGLTEVSSAGDYATGEDCFSALIGNNRVRSSLSLFGDAELPFSPLLGEQIVETSTGLLASEIDQVVDPEGLHPERVGLAKLGIYLHTLADRVSHHICTDDSYLAGPYHALAQPNFYSMMDGPECLQTLHLIRHAWEVGVPQDQLPAADQTTQAALTAVYDELFAYAEYNGFAAQGADDTVLRDDLVADLVYALEYTDPDERVDAMVEFGCLNGIEPMPGHGSC
ncbi:hypothetical protein G6O69_26235 [Pseudenhygromyxa sp. WMMC2535]|uniref:hypothetical protein n=1 Tax=Pseudenhygromyxa sp. WMMC2535 TaxID=2712867 RepID=UPI001551B2DF|nr:hypothetical protein [Pseudenhygromyxa sp. WMMC2535]NVB41364.1 hypothetical protein [Pseudenhygromyxa sp. WMMC2535]